MVPVAAVKQLQQAVLCRRADQRRGRHRRRQARHHGRVRLHHHPQPQRDGPPAQGADHQGLTRQSVRAVNAAQAAFGRPSSWRTAGRKRTSRPKAACAGRPADAGSALADRLHVTRRRAHVQLARTADLVLRVADHLVELGDPAHGAGQREDRGEQAAPGCRWRAARCPNRSRRSGRACARRSSRLPARSSPALIASLNSGSFSRPSAPSTSWQVSRISLARGS